MGIIWIAGLFRKLLKPDEETPANIDRMKQVIVVNQSLKLPKGKLSAQVAHAAVGAYVEASRKAQAAWLSQGMPKVVLEATGEEQLLLLLEAVQEQGLPNLLVQDAGRTVIPRGTITCLGIGPAPVEDIDPITENLKLLG